ncbi:hypothetical protein HK102_012845 [Quaeritorhiza haematococci]|nr:hypothetical protein HK102_012845 [Quaeritorhiza haematococci]
MKRGYKTKETTGTTPRQKKRMLAQHCNKHYSKAYKRCTRCTERSTNHCEINVGNVVWE